MQDNPYQYSGKGHEAQSVSGRPLWIYAATIAAAGVSSGIPVLFVYFFVWPLFGEESLANRLVSVGLLAASLFLSFVVGWRTWGRLNRVHQRLRAIEMAREEFMHEHEKKLKDPAE